MQIRRITRSALRLTLAVLAVGLVVSCATSKKESPAEKQAKAITEWNKTVTKHIPDEQRAQSLMALGKQMITTQQSVINELNELNQKLTQLNLSYDTTKAEVDELYVQFEQNKNASLLQYREILFAMRKQTSEQEWRALVN